jgi:hypothetical protein
LQNTLLGLAIAFILALVAALVAPLLVDWRGYRSMFETEATRLVGLEVRVAGDLEVRLLPSPRLTLHDIEIGRPGAEEVRARSLGIELALGPLLRGEWRATEVHLVGPRLRLGLDASGRLEAPGLSIGFDPDALSIDRLGIEDGTIVLADAESGMRAELDHVWFNGEARSLIGPFKGEGAANMGGDLYPFRLSTGRYGNDGQIKLHVNVDPVARPLSAEFDGVLSAKNGGPNFEGNVSFARPVGLAARPGALSPPWRLQAKVKATPASALMQDFAFQYGSQEKGFRLTGVAEFKFGRTPRFDGVLSATQVDLDPLLSNAADGRPPSPAAVMRRLAQLAGGAFRPKFPIRIGVGIDQATLGGDTVQNLRGDISTAVDGWNLDRFEFRAPGFTQVRLSGRLAVDSDRVAFVGPAEVRTNNPGYLAAWLEGRPPAGDDVRPLSLRGELTLGSDRIAIDKLTAEFDRKTITGNFAYVFAAGARPARLDAALQAADLDFDSAFAFGKALLAGVAVERPRDMTIAADIGHATIAGLDARDLSARLKIDAGGLQIDRLAVADFSGAAFAASGRIATDPSPQGSLDIDFGARDMTPIAALLARFAPAAGEVFARRARAMAPTKLHARVALEGAPASRRGTLSIDGNLGALRLTVNGETGAGLALLDTGEVTLNGAVTADDGGQLVAMLGLDRFLRAGSGPGALKLAARGPWRGALQVSGSLDARGLEASAVGTARVLAEKPSADLHAVIGRADFAPLRGAFGGGDLPVRASGHLQLAGDELRLDDVAASVAGAAVRGNLGLTLTSPHRLQGEIEADRIDGVGMVAAAIGVPAPAENESPGAGWNWSNEPFAAGLFGDYVGKIKVKAHSVALWAPVPVRELSATLAFGNDRLSVDDIVSDIAGGRLNGTLAFVSAADGLHAGGKFTLAGTELDAFFPATARPPLAGKLALSADVDGAGRSPAALIGSLHGAGRLALVNAQIAGLDPRAFEAVTRAVDDGLAVEPSRIADMVGKALQGGMLAVKRAQAELVVNSGQVRIGRFSADSDGASLSANGRLDLVAGTVDGRIVLSGGSGGADSRADIFMSLSGPLTSPARTIDVSALTAWLTLRAVENHAKQLRAIERAAPAPSLPPPRPKNGTAPAVRPERATAAPGASVPRKRAPSLPPPVEIGPAPGNGPSSSTVGVQH